MLKARLAGQPILLLIDTGANHTCFNHSFITSLQSDDVCVIGQDDVNVGIGGADFETVIAEVAGLRIAQACFPLTTARLLNLDPVNEMYVRAGFKPIQGILGGDFLVRYHAVIDYDKLILTIQKRDNQ